MGNQPKGLPMRRVRQRVGGVLALSVLVVLSGASVAGAKYVTGRQTPVNETTFKMTGDLLGTWKGLTFKVLKQNPFLYAKGTERFTGCIDQNRDRSCTGDPTGTIDFSFHYWARMKGKQTQLGTCAHRITRSSGGLKGVTGFLMMVDTPDRKGHVTTTYEGDLSLPGASTARAARAAAC
jgi:hypothetical protein